LEIIRQWFRRHFSDPQVVILAVVLVGLLAAVVLAGRMLAPALAGLVIAYLLDSPASWLRRQGVPHLLAVSLVFLGFVGLAFFGAFAVLPLLVNQLTQLVGLLPTMISHVQELLLELPQRYPTLIDREQVIEITAALRAELVSLAQSVVVFSWDRINNLFTVIVYVFLVPLVVWFLLKDKEQILRWLLRFLPSEHSLSSRVWAEVNRKTGDYVRGKVYEIVVVGAASWIAFSWVGLNFAVLLAVLTGFSVLIPYLGVAAVAFPVTLVAFFQFGPTGDMLWVLVAYGIIQILDGNLLAPLLLSEVVQLHPIAIVLAILIFGGIWGFWGLFFSIPLATVADAVLRAWPVLDSNAVAAEGEGAQPSR